MVSRFGIWDFEILSGFVVRGQERPSIGWRRWVFFSLTFEYNEKPGGLLLDSYAPTGSPPPGKSS